MRWLAANPSRQVIEHLMTELPADEILATLLANRFLENADQARAFLRPELRAFPDPATLPEMDRAAERLATAIVDREPILIWGDYDVDGITSTVLMLNFISEYRGKASYFLPHREVDGYGLNCTQVQKVIDQGFKLVVTVDCGTSNLDEIRMLNRGGVDVIVTDHHTINDAHPEALAFLNPQRADAPPHFRPLAGVGVAFLLLAGTKTALARRDFHVGTPLKSYLDIVALGTVADMVPMVDVNRLLVYHGLKSWQAPARPGLLALKRVARIEDRIMGSGDISFNIAPRLNAAGRMDSARKSVELLRSPSFSKSLVLARELDQLNTDRKTLETRIFNSACSQVEGQLAHPHLPGVIVTSGRDWTKGVLGIVASRLVARYHRPSLVLAVDEAGMASGSGRSIKGFDIVSALDTCKELLTAYGGHTMAAGVTIHEERLGQLKARLGDIFAGQVAPEDLEPSIEIDMELPLPDLAVDALNACNQLAPFGPGNPQVRFSARGVRVLARTTVGKDKSHLKLVLEAGEGRELDALAFRRGDDPVQVGDRIDIAYVPEMKTWRGVRTLQLLIEDFR